MADKAISGDFALSLIPLLLLSRFALIMISYGSSSAGGIFAPMLVIGALGGLLFGMSVEAAAPSLISHPRTFALLGMGALFTSVLRAPLTGIVLMVEMTGEYAFMLPLLVSCLTVYDIAEAFRAPAIYEALRHRCSPAR